jgi:DNA-binding beta-propeller fold protein YncE
MFNLSLRSFAIPTVCICTAAAFTPTHATDSISTKLVKDKPIALPTGFQYPNGIARASNGLLYVGSVTSGKILKIHTDGKIETFFAGSEEIFAATSLRLDEQRGVLWGTSPDFLGTRNANGEVVRKPHRLFALDTRTGKALRVIKMPDGGFGNDIALDADGGVYLTDSNRPRIHYLAPQTDQLKVWVEDDRLRATPIGLAGIARAGNGVMVVSLYSDGRLFKISTQPQGRQVEPIALQRPIENPDGMVFMQDGSLLVLEGGVQSGNGRLLRIVDVLKPGSTPKTVETLAEQMDTPVNLTVSNQAVWVTESRIRHRVLPGKEKEVPEAFSIHRFAYQ